MEYLSKPVTEDKSLWASSHGVTVHCTNRCSKSLTALVNSRVDNFLVNIVPELISRYFTSSTL